MLATAPSEVDESQGYPLRDARGIVIMEALRKVPTADGKPLRREDVSWGTALGCAPFGGGDWARFAAQMKGENNRRARRGEALIPSPMECCAPRLHAVLADTENIIPMGSTAYKAVLGVDQNVMSVRGTISEAPINTSLGQKIAKIAPTVSNYLYKRRWLSIMQLDVVRAMLWFDGRLPWREPAVCVTRDPQQIKDWFANRSGDLVYDLETDGIYPRGVKVRCIGFGDGDSSLVVPIYDIDGSSMWNDAMRRNVINYCSDRLEDDRYRWWGHNAGYFDRLVWEFFTQRETGVARTPKLAHDTLIISSIIMPEHPKTLGFNATVHSLEGTPAWKADHTAVTARDMQELGGYCALDTVLNSRIAPRMLDLVKQKGQEAPYRVLVGMQGVCADLHRVGLPVNGHKQARMETWCRTAEVHHRKRVLDAIYRTGTQVEGFGKPQRKGDPCLFNPNSPEQVRTLLFEKWGLQPPSTMQAKDLFTDSGDYSVSKRVLVEMTYDPQLSAEQAAAMRALLVFKRWSKRRSTVASWVPRHWEGATYAGKIGASRVLAPGRYTKKYRTDGSSFTVRKFVGCVDPHTGKIHASWNAHGTNVSRLACSGPNLLNVEAPLRELAEAPPGHKFVYADWSALHLRLMAAFWKIPRLIQASTQDLDPHALMCGIIFGEKFWRVPGHPDPTRRGAMGDYTGPAKKMRTPIKAFQYGMGYEASVPTIFRLMMSQTQDDGTRAFPDLREEDIAAFHEKTLALEPGWQANWKRLKDQWKLHGFVAEPVNGRKCWFEDGYITDGRFHDDDDDDQIGGNVGNQIPNFEILGAEGSFASNVTLEFVRRVPFNYAGEGTGLVHQNYDSFLAIVPDHDVTRVAGILENCMNQSINGIPMKATATWGQTWLQAS